MLISQENHPRPVKSLRRKIDGTGLVERGSPEVWLDRIKRLDVLRDIIAKNVEWAGEEHELLYIEVNDTSSMMSVTE